MVRAVGVIRHAHNEGVFALKEQVRYVGREGEVAARVRAGVHAVHPDAGALVDRAEVQQHAPDVEVLRQRELTPVPEVLPRLQHTAYAGQLALQREGDYYIPVILLRLGVESGNGVLPDAVQIKEALAPELRPGIFGQGVLAVESLAPFGCKHDPASVSWLG